jgi:hypothetical protein
MEGTRRIVMFGLIGSIALALVIALAFECAYRVLKKVPTKNTDLDGEGRAEL